MLVCMLGTLFNFANILVLTHRDMRNPVNMILTGIAVADCLVMIEYIPFTIHMRRLDDSTIPKEETVRKGLLFFVTVFFMHLRKSRFYPGRQLVGWSVTDFHC